MAVPRRNVACPRDPIALSAPEAAAFLGVGQTMFERAVEQGLLPDGRMLLGRVLWSASELEAAFQRLPRRRPMTQDGSADIDWGAPRA